MAGILFTNKQIALVGYNSKTGKIVGIGGKKKRNELPYQTALRETIEELFELTIGIDEIITTLSSKLVFDECISRNGYSTFIMSFKDLETVISVVSVCGIPSRVYSRLPISIHELLLSRTQSLYAEITSLVLIPCINNFEVSQCLLNDLKTFTCTE